MSGGGRDRTGAGHGEILALTLLIEGAVLTAYVSAPQPDAWNHGGGAQEDSAVAEKIAGAERIPSSGPAVEATELVRDAAPPLLFDHSRRDDLFGMPQGQRRAPSSWIRNRSTSGRCSTTWIGPIDTGPRDSDSRSTARTRRVGSSSSTGQARSS